MINSKNRNKIRSYKSDIYITNKSSARLKELGALAYQGTSLNCR